MAGIVPGWRSGTTAVHAVAEGIGGDLWVAVQK
jgi:hypothetical protein